jgi:hypothetical protein
VGFLCFGYNGKTSGENYWIDVQIDEKTFGCA